ncbi:MAG TPA: DNA polymerase ligase N-terminal domain-containing protein, partial [Thermoanaerobaculia bacterium]|nr:DNA polymerase ligase N-terminal domain-containing protein [Thermoanaerobaculia bacterium]
MAPRRDPLREYRAKRPAGRSPEPGGALPGRAAAAPSPGGVFVIHLHAARRLHYDLRLEWDGVLKSWAVPKGPSLDPAEKRLAVHVEDHPIEYAEFEGLIPEGNYGAGAMILWDRGVWIPEGDPEEGLVKGKLLFELRGHKLRGVWTLVRLKKTEKEWLMIRERRGREEEASQPAEADDLPAQSVFSGLTVEQLAARHDPAPAIHERLTRLAAPRRTLPASQVSMMLARRSERPFSRAGWIFELKLDGYRMLAGKTAEQVALVTRNGNDATATFPDLSAALRALPYDRFILDGEVVVHDEAGLPSFQALQK